jgi:hypothetical protein
MMQSVEFTAKVINGSIELPAALRERFHGEVNVIVFAEDSAQHPATWPEQNRRRWELIAKKARQQLTDAEAGELATLQRCADEHLGQVGPRPVEELEQLYAQLTQEE